MQQLSLPVGYETVYQMRIRIPYKKWELTVEFSTQALNQQFLELMHDLLVAKPCHPSL